jgi:uncharacterized membrane protein
MRVRPLHLIVLVLAVGGVVVLADHALRGGFSAADYERVAPGRDGTVVIDVSALGPSQVRFFHFLNSANQEVRFFVGRDPGGAVLAAFDANDLCAKTKRGYRHEGEWLVCNKCDKAFRLAEVNAGHGGCSPVPVVHRVDGGRVILTEADILKGWRYFL